MTGFFSALKSDCQRFGYLVHTSYDVDTIYSRFSALWRSFKHEIHNKYEIYYRYLLNIIFLRNTMNNWQYQVKIHPLMMSF